MLSEKRVTIMAIRYTILALLAKRLGQDASHPYCKANILITVLDLPNEPRAARQSLWSKETITQYAEQVLNAWLESPEYTTTSINEWMSAKVDGDYKAWSEGQVSAT